MFDSLLKNLLDSLLKRYARSKYVNIKNMGSLPDFITDKDKRINKEPMKHLKSSERVS